MLKREFVPDAIISVVKTIEHSGFNVFIVGGAVRDLLLGRIPIEYDLATNALPNDIIQLFDHTTPVGINYGTVLVHHDGANIEVTTFRTESGYNDQRHPEHVHFVSSIQDDLRRRDLTINAMAYQPLKESLIDPFDGRKDLDLRQIRTVGNPLHRFEEDALRPYRCFRFMSQLGFGLQLDLREALKQLSNIQQPAIERIRYEMERMLMGRYWSAGVSAMTLTGWLDHFGISIDVHSIPQLPHDRLFRWAWLISHGNFDQLSKIFQFSKQDIRQMKHILSWNFDEFAILFELSDLAVNTEQLQSLGFQGKDLGAIQSHLLELVRSKMLLNQKDVLLDEAKKIIKN